MANDEHVKWLLEGVDAWNQRRQTDFFRPDLSRLNVRDKFEGAGLLGHDGRVWLSRIHLENAHLFEADLSHAALYDAKLNGADLTLANLKGAQLDGADLTNANLHAAKIRGANLEYAVLMGTNLTGTKPWKALLYSPTNGMDRPPPDLDGLCEIGCLENLLEVCRKIRLHYYSPDGRPKDVRLPRNVVELKRYEREGPFVENMRFYFRGERCSCTSWELRPSLLRSEASPGLRGFEGEMLLDLMARRPEEFGEAASAVEQWVLAQHHGLQTRLVDVSRNPLVALFNACQDCPTCNDGDGEARSRNGDGRLHIIAVPKTMVKPFNSDTVSVVANFGKLSRAEQDLLLGKRWEETGGSKGSGSPDLEIWPESGGRWVSGYTWGQQVKRGRSMLGERSDQRGLWEADRLYLDHVGRESFYGLLASLRGRLFRDAEFAEFYCADNGRDSVPPSLLATALLLQSHDKVSDSEAKARADFDLRWKVALGIEVEGRPFAKSTLQVFRAQLILHDKVREVFESSLRLARESGYLKRRGMRVALDTTNILGRGAVKDTCNLLADGIVKLLRALAQLKGINVGEWAKIQGYHRYLGSSIKGEAAIDWSDRQARKALLAEIVADADRLLELSRQAQGELPEDSAERQGIVAAAELLGQLLLQDVERTDDGVGLGVSLKDGVSRDRMMSAHDPQMRHGHKSSSKRFDGHKAAIVVDTDTQLITAVEVLPGNAPDNSGALELVEQSETNTGVTVEEAMGDAAYGDGDTRQAFADAGRTLIARVPGRPNRTHFPKEDFRIDLEAGSCTCPAGNVTRTMAPAGWRTGQTGRTYRLEAFRFDAAVCGVCPLRPRCVAAKPGTGRTVQLHPQEGLLQQARALQQSEAFAEYRERRVVVEHRLARLVQLGIRQSRYFGRIKTRFQLYLAATVANLTLVASKAGMTGEPGSGPSAGSPQVAGMVNSATAWLGQIWTLSLLVSALLTKSLFPIRGFRPGF